MKPSPQRILFMVLALYAVLWFVPEKKSAFLVIAVFVGYLWYRSRNITETLVVSFLAVSPLAIGKQFLIELISASQLNIPGRSLGIGVDIVLTARDGIAILMASRVLSESYNSRKLPLPRDALGWSLFLLPVAFAVATLGGSILPGISFIHTLFFWEPYIVYMFLTGTIEPVRRSALVAAVIAVVLFEGVLALSQALVGGPLGLAIEYFPEYSPLDLSRDVGSATLRMGGTFAHANLLAAYLLFMVPVIIPAIFDRAGRFGQQALVAVLLGGIAFMTTLSRSAWIGFTVAVLVFFYLTEKRWAYRLSLPGGLTRWGKVLIAMAGIGTVLLVLPRLSSTLYTFERFGSVETRGLLLAEAVKVIGKHPVFGVGLGMDVYYMFRHSRAFSEGETVFTYFPEPVHNGLLKLLVETGLVGLLAYLAVLFGIIARLLARINRNAASGRLYLAGLFAAICATLVNIQFQPLLPDLQQMVLLTIIYVSVSGDGVARRYA